jgi:Fe-S-cluster containining protein
MDPLQAAIRDISKEERSFHPDQRTLSALQLINQRHLCQRCGKCCTNQVVGMLGRELVAIARHLNMPASDFKKMFIECQAGKWLMIKRMDNGECPFLVHEGDDEDGAAKCVIYEVRPETCRRFPWLTPMIMTESKFPALAVNDQLCPMMSVTFGLVTGMPMPDRREPNTEASGEPVAPEYDSVGGGTD